MSKINQKTMLVMAIFILIINCLSFINSVYAIKIDSANVYMVGDCGQLLTYKGTVVKVSYVEYTNNGDNYPAYCMDKTKPGAETESYNVSIQDIIKDVGLWRRIINGYPYKTIQELGVLNKEEAFTATKQAIYCYIHGNNPDDYGAIGEAGERTLNAMKKIINDANNSNETKMTNTLTINKITNEWKQDNKEKEYVSKTYMVTSNASIGNYIVSLSKENSIDIGGIKLTDENNNERNEFSPNEKFKILVPIKNMKEKGAFSLKAEAQVKTKPVLYGMAPNGNFQDYALTAATFEDGIGNIKDEYNINETKIIIIKQNEENKKLLEGVEFEVLDDEKKIIYSDIKTNKEGKAIIENLVPGTYYIKETKATDGYEINNQLIKVEVELNQEYTVLVNNKEKKQDEVQVKKANKEIKRLPVTGM